MATPSSYYPSECSVCGKNRLGRTQQILVSSWQNRFVSDRNNLLNRLNNQEMTLDEMSKLDSKMPGFCDQDWQRAGIQSDCCKLEILTHIPYDVHQRDFNDADATLPVDFDTKLVQSRTIQTEKSLVQPPVFLPIGTHAQYNN